ncbi:hypothetical protein LUW77_28350 [Streptomyces radiopugnans]|nr:hypothetical protein LUW77_28350 [Streptomyces radiopugnans]
MSAQARLSRRAHGADHLHGLHRGLQAPARLPDQRAPRHGEAVEAETGQIGTAHARGAAGAATGRGGLFTVQQQRGEGGRAAPAGAGHHQQPVAPPAESDQPLLAGQRIAAGDRLGPRLVGEQVAAVVGLGEGEAERAALVQQPYDVLALPGGAYDQHTGGRGDAEHGGGHDRRVPAGGGPHQHQRGVQGLQGAAEGGRDEGGAQPRPGLCGQCVRTGVGGVPA